MLFKVIAVAALAAAIAIAVFVFSMPRQSEAGAPNVKFTEFAPDRTEIKVGETSKVVFNVQNLEERAINNSKVMIEIEPSGYQPYISINNPITELPAMYSKDARTGQIQVLITAIGSPAKEAVYRVKGVLFADSKQTDVRDFDLKISLQ